MHVFLSIISGIHWLPVLSVFAGVGLLGLLLWKVPESWELVLEIVCSILESL